MNRLLHLAAPVTLALALAACPAFAAGKGKGYGNMNNNNNNNNNQTNTQSTPQTPQQQQQPPIDTSQVKSAQSDLAAARDDEHKAEVALAEIVRKLQADFDASDAMKAAIVNLRSAQSGYDAASKAVVDKLGSNPAYKSAVADRAAADAKAVKARQDGASPDDITASLNDALAKASVVSKMQMEAIAVDTPASEAKAKLAQANQEIAALHKQFTESLKDNADWAAAKKTVDDAKDKVKTCQSALADAQKNLAQQQASRRGS